MNRADEAGPRGYSGMGRDVVIGDSGCGSGRSESPPKSPNVASPLKRLWSLLVSLPWSITMVSSRQHNFSQAAG
jgi:hypothetical protein